MSIFSSLQALFKKSDLFTQAQVDKRITEAKEPFIEAIAAIYRAPVYQDNLRENGISLQFINALHSAAEMAGLKPPGINLSPDLKELSRLLEILEARNIYPKLMGNDVQVWLEEVRALIQSTNLSNIRKHK